MPFISKGTRKTEFDPKKTAKKVFYNLGRNTKEVDTMIFTEKLNYYENKEVQEVELPYKKDSMSSVIILPIKGKNKNYKNYSKK